MLLTELGIPSLEVYLGQQAKIYRMRMVDTPKYKELEQIRLKSPLDRVKTACNRHPFHLLFREANASIRLVEKNEFTTLKAEFTKSNDKQKDFSPSRKQLREAIKRFVSRDADDRSKSEWKSYLDAHGEGRCQGSVNGSLPAILVAGLPSFPLSAERHSGLTNSRGWATGGWKNTTNPASRLQMLGLGMESSPSLRRITAGFGRPIKLGFCERIVMEIKILNQVGYGVLVPIEARKFIIERNSGA
ncbi:unnamed protein product [Clonostachys chloroleuca]|uniref:Uncharacterized protein n=1 Tax=Clonostachys chloroleuca TaxID=1926264 RepID=A0AA35LR41_9HYPO|nr:unnamed protein product [Clonostachys chloroleuca]